jgi:hypothetical protein
VAITRWAVGPDRGKSAPSSEQIHKEGRMRRILLAILVTKAARESAVAHLKRRDRTDRSGPSPPPRDGLEMPAALM